VFSACTEPHVKSGRIIIPASKLRVFTKNVQTYGATGLESTGTVLTPAKGAVIRSDGHLVGGEATLFEFE
jgi:hypothetical protein